MAALKASELKYGTPLKVSVGGLFFTATQVEIPSGKEYEVGTLELNLAKLGLSDESIAGLGSLIQTEPGIGETASTTGEAAFAWCTNAVEAKTENEAAKEVATGFLTQLAPVGTKLFLRIYGVTTAGDGKPINEAKTATKVTASANLVTTVFALGK